MDRMTPPSATEPRKRKSRAARARLAGVVLALAVAAANAASGQEGPSAAGPDGAAPPALERVAPEAPAAGTGPAADPAGADPAAAERAPAPVAELSLPRDLSPWGMFQAADRVVKAVMIGLVLGSLVTWTIFLAKSLEILLAGARLGPGLRIVTQARDLDEAERALAGRRGPLTAMLRAARHEAGAAPATLRHGEGLGFLPRVGSHVGRIEAREVRRLNVGVGVLATIGATAPFVGLFGTVWGIMNSFIGIAETQTTNLAVVAPGIAEALLATGLGLVAAIPAVVIYNLFARWIASYRARLADAGAAVERLVSRDLDHRRLVPSVVARAAE